DHAGGAITGAGRERQARNATTTNAGCKALHTDNAFSRDYAGHAIACKQPGSANASARGKTSDTSAADAGQAGHGLAFAATRQRRQARNSAATDSRRTSGTTAGKASCAGGCRRGPAATGRAKGWSTATKGVPTRQDQGGRGPPHRFPRHALRQHPYVQT